MSIAKAPHIMENLKVQNKQPLLHWPPSGEGVLIILFSFWLLCQCLSLKVPRDLSLSESPAEKFDFINVPSEEVDISELGGISVAGFQICFPETEDRCVLYSKQNYHRGLRKLQC